MNTVYLALGSNLGDRLANLQAAEAALAPEIRLLAASPVYETPPWGVVDQPAFLNQVLQVETELDPPALLQRIKQLERDLGRQPSVRYGPRQIDIDILFYGDLIFNSLVLSIPHPRLDERAFVLAPLADLAPDLLHPVLGLSVRQMLEKVDRSGIVLYQGT